MLDFVYVFLYVLSFACGHALINVREQENGDDVSIAMASDCDVFFLREEVRSETSYIV